MGYDVEIMWVPACVWIRQNNKTSKEFICAVMNAQLFHCYILLHRSRTNKIQKMSGSLKMITTKRFTSHLLLLETLLYRVLTVGIAADLLLL